MSKKLSLILLSIIVVIAVFLRFWQLGNVPPSPDWDEAALGYNAYSILQTGRDEFGKFLPVVLESFGDYKPALYVYLAIPSIFVFGLTSFAVRFPSAVFGVLAVILTYFLVKELFSKSQHKEKDTVTEAAALISAFLLAVSPWSIQFSRVAFEANTGVTFNILTVLFFLKGLKNPWLLSLSTLFAALGIYTYQSERIFLPLLFVIMIVIFAKDLVKISKKYLFAALIVGILFMLPMMLFTFGNTNSLARFKGTSILSQQTKILKNNVEDVARDNKNDDIIGKVLDNRRLTYGKTIVGGYLSHFDPNWLFITGDIARHHAPGVGLLYLVEIPFLLIGIYILLFSDLDKNKKLLIFLWFLAVPIPASVTNDVPHAVRTINFLPIFSIFTAAGIVASYKYISEIKSKMLNHRIKYFFYVVFCALFMFNFIYFMNQYFVQLNYFDASEWQYGYQQAINYVLQTENGVNQIVVSDNQPLDKSYIFFLFYTKFPPQDYQKLNNKNGDVHKFGKFIFKPLDWSRDSQMTNTLFVAGPNDIPGEVVPVKTIYYPDGTTAIKIIKN